jgi:effector-binding domain-containing protein
MEYHVEVKQLDSQATAVVRRCARADELARVIPEGCGLVWGVLKAIPFRGAGRHVAVYWDGQINLEVGVEVDAPFPGHGEVVASQTPAGMAATVAHFGPYDRLGEAHAAIRKYCSDHGHVLAGPNWEIYGHWNDDPAQLRTDVFYLLANGGKSSHPGNEEWVHSERGGFRGWTT